MSPDKDRTIAALRAKIEDCDRVLRRETARLEAAVKSSEQRYQQLIDQKVSAELQLAALRRTSGMMAERAALLLARTWSLWHKPADPDEWIELMNEIARELDVREKRNG